MSGRRRSPRPTIRHIAVVIPARNEATLLARCLHSVSDAAAVLRSALPSAVAVVVVLDRCVDETPAVLRRWPWVTAVTTDRGMVGAARARGVATVLDGQPRRSRSSSRSETPGPDPQRVWIACTDADSEVPRDWLTHQLELASAGVDLALGTVALHEGTDGAMARAWQAAYSRGVTSASHVHVHGANLGVRGSTYLAAGGFPEVPAHEDVALARAVARLDDAKIVYTLGAPVVTSGRLRGRATAGVAADLRAMNHVGP